MTSVPRLGSLSAPPHPASQFITVSSPPPEAFVAMPQPQPQAIAIEEAAGKDLDSTYKYWTEGDDAPEVASNAIVVVDIATQWSRPFSRLGSAAASPAPLVGVRISGVIEAIITSAAPVYQAPRQPPPSGLPPDSAP